MAQFNNSTLVNITDQLVLNDEGKEKEEYLNDLNELSNIHQIIYQTVRHIQLLVGLVGNTLTLIIIRNLKSVMNGHILMAYLAVSDILVCLFAPVSLFSAATWDSQYWKEICIIKNALYFQVLLASVLSYLVLSIDR